METWVSIPRSFGIIHGYLDSTAAYTTLSINDLDSDCKAIQNQTVTQLQRMRKRLYNSTIRAVIV